ncbi:MAG: MarR family transcriptional regulator [Burkholderiales bacterium]|nr:MarR family transcriptional regulator [Opitutaceae bacterium]
MSSVNAQRLVHDIVATADLFLRESTRLFRPHGLTAPQFNVLNLLAGRTDGQGYSQRELADTLVVDRSNVTGLLDRMEAAGWVRRVDDPSDRRVYRVQLTATGKKLWQKVAPGYADVVAQVTARLGEKDMGETLRLLEVLREDATRWVAPKG